jgi:hypothetical protein
MITAIELERLSRVNDEYVFADRAMQQARSERVTVQ